jgi:hypothetical protein
MLSAPGPPSMTVYASYVRPGDDAVTAGAAVDIVAVEHLDVVITGAAVDGGRRPHRR